MCGGVEIFTEEKARKIYFVGESAALPVMMENTDQVEWIRWGRRKNEKSNAPQGGWARLTNIQAGDWTIYQPRRGVACVERFLQGERNSGLRGRRLSQWIFAPKGQGIECLVIGEGDERRAYMVVTTPPAKFKSIADRWPLLTELIESMAPIHEASIPPSTSDDFLCYEEAASS